MNPAQAPLVEDKAQRDEHFLFEDRRDAGLALAELVRPDLAELEPAVCLAIPSGGVPVGLALAAALSLDFDLLVARKLQIPGNTEAGFGAVALGGEPFLNRELMERLGLDETDTARAAAEVKPQLARRNARFRADRAPPDLSGRTAIIADDGLASGFTMLAALRAARDLGADAVCAAVPTAPKHSIERIRPETDRIWCVNVRDTLRFAVAAAYRNWRDLDEDEVVRMLADAGFPTG